MVFVCLDVFLVVKGMQYQISHHLRESLAGSAGLEGTVICASVLHDVRYKPMHAKSITHLNQVVGTYTSIW